jgi:hypothetical protein
LGAFHASYPRVSLWADQATADELVAVGQLKGQLVSRKGDVRDADTI